jgi:hypothetical protein
MARVPFLDGVGTAFMQTTRHSMHSSAAARKAKACRKACHKEQLRARSHANTRQTCYDVMLAEAELS